LSGASEADVLSAVGRCDAAALGATDGHFAVTARDGKTVRLARTIGIPLRYFVAKMYHGPFLVVAERMDQIFAWCRDERIAWQFDPAYTRMVPAHYIVELDQVGCPDPSPRYHRFFEPAVGRGSSDPGEIGARYVAAAYESVLGWLKTVPIDEPVAVAFSGGVDSTSVLLMAVHANAALGGHPDRIRAFTLDMGGGSDATQAERVVRELGLERQWERVSASPADDDLEAAIRLIEDYHPLDVECAAAAMCLLRGIRERDPRLTYLLDGDGGDENLKSYPLEDSDLTLSSILRNPLLYQEGWGVDAIKHSLAYSGGLSRGYVRTYAPAAARRGDPVRADARRRCVEARHAEAGGRRRRRQSHARHRHADQPEAAIPGRRHGDAARAGLEGVVPADVQRALAGSAEGRGLAPQEIWKRTCPRVMQDAKCKMQMRHLKGGCKKAGLQYLHFESCILNYRINSSSNTVARRIA
jgi:asparagine synthase (glutamine-hydrolysing)